MIRSLWQDLSQSARIGLVAGIVCIALLTGVFGYWALRTEYQVLFADLTPQDTAAMVAELDRLKIPYQLGEQGSSILVDRDMVYKTRIKLMGKDLPLHGAVGLELFNNSDFGMTEFAQKINYQRALQGEITRTILSLSEIRDVRVHLALPEQGLFKQASSKAKAAITLTLKQGQALRPEQVTGIQRLVSASVPGIATQDVTIVDQHGVALTRVSGGDGEAETGSGRLDLKKETENYLARKAVEVLERTFGQGQALASVDVTLDMDRIQTTTEDVLPVPGKVGQGPTGVVQRERESVRETGAPLDSRVADANASLRGGSTQRETDYALGRRVEQVVSQPGSVRRIQVVAIVRKPLDSAQQDQLRRLIAAAVGASLERGDTVVVQTMDALLPANSPGQVPVDEIGVTGRADDRLGRELTAEAGAPPHPFMIGMGLLLLAICAGVGVQIFRRARPKGRANGNPAQAQPPLSEAQRRAALAQVEAWMRGDSRGNGRGEAL
ncbi:flagellar basal-body MS-ring/collar protein FliF [Cupriavidus sp. 8B]